MDNLQQPQSQETKDFLEKECGLRPFQPTREPNYANPDKMEYHIFNLAILGASLAGRQYARTLGLPTIPFTFSAILVPAFYFLSVHHKEKRFNYTSGERKTFEQNLEFYPITRRAWNRAIAIHEGAPAAGNKQ